MNNSKMKKVLIRPFTYIHDSVGIEATKMCALLGIQFLMLIFTKSWGSVFNVLAAVLGSECAYFINQKINKYNIFDYFAHLLCIVQGMMAGLLVPSTFNPFTVFVITLIVMLVIKHFFGGFSYAWANPSIFTILVLWIVGYRLFPGFELTSDLLTMRNPSQTMIENGIFPICKYDSTITDIFNSSIFSLLRVSIPEGYVSLFWDTNSIIPAFRFNFITIISSIFLFCDDLVKTIIPGTFLAVYLILVRLFGPVFFNGVFMQGDMLLALLTGGTLFTTVFLIGWYGTTPVSITGKVVYGILAGIAAFLICGCGTSPCGMAFTVLISNIISIIIQQYESSIDKKKLLKLMNNYKKNEIAGEN